MKALILALLALAVWRSIPQLAMMPRWARWIVWTAWTALPVWLLHGAAARYNLEALGRMLAARGNLESLCTVVVVQELLVLLAGFGYAARLEAGLQPRWRHYAALAPSLLVPVGVLYVLAACFNRWVNGNFAVIDWSVALGSALLGGLSGEAACRWRRTPEARLRAVLNGGMLLLIPAIFLPAAAVAEYSREGGGPAVSPWPALGLLGGIALLAFAVIHGIKIIRKAA